MSTSVTGNAGKLLLPVLELHKSVTLMCLNPMFLHPCLTLLRVGFAAANCGKYLLDTDRPVADHRIS